MYKRVDHIRPLCEGEVPRHYVYGPSGEIYEEVPDPNYVEDYDGIDPDTDTYYLDGREEYWGWVTVCKACGTQFQAFTGDEGVRNYCPGCGKRLV